MSYTFEASKAGYANLWDAMAIRPERVASIDQMARKIFANKEQYKRTEAWTNVPWWFVGVLHARESSCNFKTHLHNGDPLTARTKHVPAGRPLTGSPTFDFWYSAADALTMKGFHLIKAWSIERALYCGETYNGTGYLGRDNSPYVWAGSYTYDNHGKFVSDGHYDANFTDPQPGIAPLIKRLTELDPSIILLREMRSQPAIAEVDNGTPENSPEPSGNVVDVAALVPVETQPVAPSQKAVAQVHKETVQTLRDNGSRTIGGIDRIRAYIRAAMAALGITSLADAVTTKQSVQALMPEQAVGLPDIHPLFLVCGVFCIGVLVLIAWELHKLLEVRVDTAINGQQDRGIE